MSEEELIAKIFANPDKKVQRNFGKPYNIFVYSYKTDTTGLAYYYLNNEQNYIYKETITYNNENL